MKLSEYFTLEEMVRSDTATRMGIYNFPNDEQISNLKQVCGELLDPIRRAFGPFSPNSGFRCLTLNRAVGGSPTSQHIKGEAVDIEVPGIDNLSLAEWCREHLDFDQLILENYTAGDINSGWVHISISVKNRHEVLTKGKNIYMRGLPERI